MKRFRNIALNSFSTLFGGLVIANIVGRLPIEIPATLKDALHAIGHDELADPIGMRILLMLVIVIASIIAAGIIVWMVNLAIANHRASRKTNMPIRRPRVPRETMPKHRVNDK